MSNNKQSIKLYTEEQMRKALRTYLDLSKFLTENDVIKEFTPIELPSDDEIVEQGNLIKDSSMQSIYILGAKWMRDKILGGNK